MILMHYQVREKRQNNKQKLIRFQKRLSRITSEEEKILNLFDLIGEGYNKNDQIEYKQQEIHQQLKQIAIEESDYRILVILYEWNE